MRIVYNCIKTKIAQGNNFCEKMSRKLYKKVSRMRVQKGKTEFNVSRKTFRENVIDIEY